VGSEAALTLQPETPVAMKSMIAPTDNAGLIFFKESVFISFPPFTRQD
jgi:hypothetical protein